MRFEGNPIAWPVVVPNDDGIRPAGSKDECFYCQKRIGEPHGAECVMVTKRIEMAVKADLPDGVVLEGRWRLDVPYFWDDDKCEFHKNDSSWCATNFMYEESKNSVEWLAPEAWTKLNAHYELVGGVKNVGCMCRVLSFEFRSVIDDTPRREVR